MKRIVVVALSSALVLGSAAAQVVPPPPLANPAKVFTAVDAVTSMGSYVYVTGIVQGETPPSSWSWRPYYTSDTAASAQQVDNCVRIALLAMAKPGQYLLEISAGSSYSTNYYCKLTRVTP